MTHHPLTVLVLTPSLGGHYFGEIISGLTREVSRAGGRLVLVQTLEPGAVSDEMGEPGDFATPVALAEVDGVVAITTAVHGEFLQRLRDAGKPVVLTSTRMTDFAAPLAVPDNGGGTFAAVEHLIEHGHTRIGFVGNLAQPDVFDRHVAYVQALEAHGLVADPDFLLAAPDNAQTGGAHAARTMLASAERPTAVMVATDRNAIGFMRRLNEAGVDVPGDMAVVAFDNTEAAVFNTPSLSSVDQRFDELGALAASLVLAEIRGEKVPYVAHTLPSAMVSIRESCGCDPDAARAQPSAAGAPDPSPPRLLRDELDDLICSVLETGHGTVTEIQRAAVVGAVLEAEDLLREGDAVTTRRIRALTMSLHRLSPRPEVLRRVTAAIIEFVHASALVQARAQGDGTKLTGAARVTTALWRLQSGAFLRQAEGTEDVLDEQFVVDGGLVDTDRTDPRGLGWLAGTHVRAGLLALWEDGPASGRLQVVGKYDPDDLLPALVDTATTPEHFPPIELITAVKPTDRGVCIVVPVRSKERDWGLLAVVGAINTTSARETYHHWAALLSASLESERLQDAVRRNALYDALTGLPNRRLFLDRLAQSVAQWHRSSTPFAMIFLDLDGFKLINDSLGHQMGDRVLNVVGERIDRALRTVDTGARFGGDEFAILLHDVSPLDVLLVTRRIQDTLAEVIDVDGHEFSIGASLGVATSAIEYASAEDVLRDADTAMYQAKAAERGSVSFFDAAMHARAVEQLKLHSELRRALDTHEFEVHYQPIVNLSTGRADRFEALVRWRHPERGLVLPDDFLPLMGETALIVQLGHWIIDEVCRQLTAWGPGVVNVAVNISDREFWHSGLLTQVLQSLERHHLTPDRLTLEITEGVIMRRPETALRLMREMHDAGLQLHIDDFGTGHSSLETLHRFPVDAFKIDRSFISALTTGDRTDELVRAIVAMGRALGLDVVAEGIETSEQLAFLQEIGCTTGQGFLFTPAIAGERGAELLERDLRAGAPNGESRGGAAGPPLEPVLQQR